MVISLSHALYFSPQNPILIHVTPFLGFVVFFLQRLICIDSYITSVVYLDYGHNIRGIG
jgi:hypothetical protein